MPMSHFPHGFANGVEIRGVPVLNSYPGNVFWVDSGAGSDGNPGTFDRPFATLDYAVGRCTANNGDIIMVKAGHAESLIADSAVDIDVAGITVRGLGTGSDRPTFTFTTAVTADFKLAANNVTVENLLFVAGIDALTGPIEISGDDCALINCEYQDDATNNYETTDVVVTASTPLRMLIDGFRYIHDGGTGGTQNQSVIQLNGADGAIIRNCWIVADAGTGVIEDATVSDQILIEWCTIENTETSPTVAIFLQGTTTGSIQFTNLRVASGTTYLTATNDMQLYEVFGTGTDATTGEKVGTQLAGDIEAKIDVIDEFHDVPAADATANAQINEVIGNKTDAAIYVPGTQNSLAAYAKGTANLQERVALKTAAVMVDNDVLFTIAGGPIKIEALWSECVTANDATASTLAYKCTPTTGSEQTISGASASLANAAAGASISLAGTALATAALFNANGPNLIANPGTVVAPIGTIGIDIAVGSTTGTWRHFIRYKPLAVGVTVT